MSDPGFAIQERLAQRPGDDAADAPSGCKPGEYHTGIRTRRLLLHFAHDAGPCAAETSCEEAVDYAECV